MGNPYAGSIKLIQESFFTKECSDEEYYKDTDRISNSSLGLINYSQNGSPKKFVDGFSSKKTDSLELGSAVHKMILEGDIYSVSAVDKPTAKIGEMIDAIHMLTSKGLSEDDAVIEASNMVDYYKGALSEARIKTLWEKGREYYNFLKVKNDADIVLTPAMKAKLEACCKSINSDLYCKKILFPKGEECYREYPIFGDAVANIESYDEELDFVSYKTVELKLKAKIDFFSIDHINKVVSLVDLKTTGKPVQTFMGYFKNVYDGQSFNPSYMTGSFQDYHYYRQMALYGDMLMHSLLNSKTINDSYKLVVKMVCVETNDPYGCYAFDVDKYSLREGRAEYKDLLKMVAYHKINGFDKVVMANDIRRES